jgi:hypothetical protein
VLRRLIGGRAENRIRPDPDWASEVQRGLSFLFIEHGAILVESTYRTDSFGLKTAVIRSGNIVLKIFRDATLPPNYIEARMAPAHSPDDLKSPLTAWIALALPVDGTTPPRPPYKGFGTLQGLRKLLQQNFVQLNEGFSPNNYALSKQRMDAVEKEHWREWTKLGNLGDIHDR